jgi:Holliday junction resolvase
MAGGSSPRKHGDYFEYQTRDDMTKRGWFVVRAAGSKGPCDLVALHHGRRPLLISCKSDGKINPDQRRTLIVTARLAGGLPMLAYRLKRGLVAYAKVVSIDRTHAIEDVNIEWLANVQAVETATE